VTITLVPDSDSGPFPKNTPNQTLKGIDGRARVALSDGDGNNLSSTGGVLDVATTGLVPEKHDYIELSYTSGQLTGVVYKVGGSGGTVVATLTLGYTSGSLTSVTRT